MKKFSQKLYPTVREETFFAPCGVADLIATCYGGRNRLVAMEYTRLKLVRTCAAYCHAQSPPCSSQWTSMCAGTFQASSAAVLGVCTLSLRLKAHTCSRVDMSSAAGWPAALLC